MLSVNKNRSRRMYSRRFAAVLTCVVCLLIPMSATAAARTAAATVVTGTNGNDNSGAEFPRLTQIRQLADQNNAEGTRQLLEFKKDIPATASDLLRLEVLKLMIDLYDDAGAIATASVAVTELRQFANVNPNNNTLIMASIAEAQYWLAQGKAEQPVRQLKSLHDLVNRNASVELALRWNVVLGQAYIAVGQLELAQEHLMDALRLSEQLRIRKAQAQLQIYAWIARVKLKLNDAEGVLKIVRHCQGRFPTLFSTKSGLFLMLTQGMALAQLHRNAESLAALKKVKDAAVDTHIPLAEVVVLNNLADLYLTAHDYAQAEATAQMAMVRAQQVDAKASLATAQFNLGFAIAAQGDLVRGVAYIDEAIRFFKNAESKSLLEIAIGKKASLYEKIVLYKEAVAIMREQQQLSDQLYRSERERAVIGMQEKFGVEQRQKQIELLAKDNGLKDADIKNHRLQQIILLLGVLVAITGGCAAFLLYRRVKRVNVQLQLVNSELEFDAVHDPLTGLYNRRSFVDLMHARKGTLPRTRRGSDPETNGLILLDIDHFKKINDTWGHAVGDKVLREIAKRLSATVRDRDMVMRWGGEEFLIYSPGATTAHLSRLVERLLHEIGAHDIVVGGQPIPVTLTAGFIGLPFAELSEVQCDWERCIQLADMALYYGKQQGRNCAVGLAALRLPQDEAMAALSDTLAHAVQAGAVELVCLTGPLQHAWSRTLSDEVGT